MNKLQVIVKKIDRQYIKENYDALVSSLYDARKKAVNRLKFENSRLTSIAAGSLLQDVIKKELGILPEKLNLEVTANGKPILKNQNFYFNLSHSGEYVVLAYGNQNVGVDIEEIKNKNLSVARRCFTEDENNYVASCAERFTEIWTMKESYLKLTGDGISVPLNSFEIDIKGLCVKGTNYFYNMKKIDNYIISVCSKNSCDVEFHIEK